MPEAPLSASLAEATPEQQKQLLGERLAAATPEQQTQFLGERLYPLIQAQAPTVAGKVTITLLKMDNGELLNLLARRAAHWGTLALQCACTLRAEGQKE